MKFKVIWFVFEKLWSYKFYSTRGAPLGEKGKKKIKQMYVKIK